MRGEWGYNPGMAWMDILRASFEILVLWIVLYQLYRMVKGSRSGAILAGLVVCLLLCTFVLRVAEARVLQEIAGFIIGPSTLLVVLFQPEIRNFLAKMGGQQSEFNLGGAFRQLTNDVTAYSAGATIKVGLPDTTAPSIVLWEDEE